MHLYSVPLYFYGLNFRYVLILFSFVYIVLNKKSFIGFITKKNIFYFTCLWFLLILYCIFTELVNSTLGEGYSITYILIYIECFIVTWAFYDLLSKQKVGHFIFMKTLVYFGIIQSIIAIGMLLNFNFKNFVFYNVLTVNENNKILEPAYYLIRGFGIGSGYFFSLPILQGLVMCVMLLYYHTKKKYYMSIILAPLFLISMLFNARISIAVLVAFLMIILFNFIKGKKYFIPIIKYFFYITIIVSLIFVFIDSSSFQTEQIEKTLEWLFADTDSGSSKTVNTLLNRHLFFPQELTSFIFGKGISLPTISLQSDIGFVQDIFFGGILFVILQFITLMSFTFYILKNNSSVFAKYLIYTMMLTLIIVNFKGTIFGVNEFIKGYFLILFIFMEKNKKQLKV